jgi:hypothetical protein
MSWLRRWIGKRRAEGPSDRYVFISVSEKFRTSLGDRLKRLLEANRFNGVIVTEAPLPPGAFDPEGKVEAYLRLSVAVIVLATPDEINEKGEARTRQNIADEIGRARSMDHLRTRIVVLKERSVLLHSNVNPAHEPLNLADPMPAFHAAMTQLRIWGLPMPEPFFLPEELEAPPGSVVSDLIRGIGIEHAIDDARRIASAELGHRTKLEQRRFVRDIVEFMVAEQSWEGRMGASHLLEALLQLDVGLFDGDGIDRLARHPDSLVRSSVAVMLYDLALRVPGLVPIDIVAMLLRGQPQDSPASGWYVFTPARNCLQILALSRPDAWPVFSEMAATRIRNLREEAATAALAVAKVRPGVVPLRLLADLAADADGTVNGLAKEAVTLVSAVPEAERGYAPFGAF